MRLPGGDRARDGRREGRRDAVGCALVSAHKTERLLNLVICLLSTRQFRLKEQIRDAVPQYAERPSDEAFDRMFERDKEELRDMGVPLETGGNDAWFDDEIGYRVDRAADALSQVSLTPDRT